MGVQTKVLFLPFRLVCTFFIENFCVGQQSKKSILLPSGGKSSAHCFKLTIPMCFTTGRIFLEILVYSVLCIMPISVECTGALWRIVWATKSSPTILK